MRVIIASTFVPFINGGARFIVEWLETKLRERGHTVERFYLPHSEDPERLLDQWLAFRLMDLSAQGDRLIAIRPPAYALRHPSKVVWFIHHIRGYYDLAGTPYQSYPDTLAGFAARDALHALDTQALGEAERVFTNSDVVRHRLKTFNDLDAETLYPPLFMPERFRDDGAGDEVVAVCRIEPHKRQALLIDAMRYTKSPVRLRISGRSSDPSYGESLQADISAAGLDDRVVLEDRWISEEEKVDRVARALAIAYLPVDEDSYGYPTLEAAAAGKPVLTASDAGGVLEFVRDGENGLVVDPDPRAVAEGLDRLYGDRTASARMGEGARRTVVDLNISWDHVVARLLA